MHAIYTETKLSHAYQCLDAWRRRRRRRKGGGLGAGNSHAREPRAFLSLNFYTLL